MYTRGRTAESQGTLHILCTARSVCVYEYHSFNQPLPRPFTTRAIQALRRRQHLRIPGAICRRVYADAGAKRRSRSREPTD